MSTSTNNHQFLGSVSPKAASRPAAGLPGANPIAYVMKRDGRLVPFHREKICDAIFAAAQTVGGSDRALAEQITDQVIELLQRRHAASASPLPGMEAFVSQPSAQNSIAPSVEEIQDLVEYVLIETGHARTAKAFILYRQARTDIREAKSALLDAVAVIEKETNRENANVGRSPSAKMLQIGTAASRAYYLNRLIPRDFAEAHKSGLIHIHDLDFYAKTLNCLQIDLEELLEKGFDTGHGYIRPPKRIGSAVAQAAIILQSNQNDMYGGQSFPHFDSALGNFLREHPASDDDIFQAMEGLVYNLNSMHSRAGAQVPFSSLNLGTDTSPEGRRVISAFLEAYERGLGYGENPIFPNVVFRLKAGVNFNPDDPNYDLYQQALRVSARRMNPTYSFMDSTFNKRYGDDVSYMGCRTRVIANRHGAEVSAKRGNIAFTTINLPRLALRYRSYPAFSQALQETLELVADQLLHRYECLSSLRVGDLPFLMGQRMYMGSEELRAEDFIEPAMRHGTLSIGFVGVAEALVLLTGRHHGEEAQSQELGLEIVEHLRKACDDFTERYDKNVTLLATPAEQAAGRFVKADRELFGVVPGITDRDYYTNSYHLPVSFETSAFTKIALEGAYHRFCNAGHISYVELPSAPTHNRQAIDSLIRHMAASDVGYAGINFPIDECMVCHYSGLIPDSGQQFRANGKDRAAKENDECPRCGSTHIRRIRRITGYFSTVDRFNESKRAELKDRVAHSF